MPSLTTASFRTRPQRDFTTIRNTAIRDPHISLKAKGALMLMLSFPDDWQFRLSHLVQLSTDGRDGLRAAVAELIEAGYVQRRQTRDDGGSFSHSEYYVADEIGTVDGKPVDGKPDTTNTEVTKEPTPLSANADSPARQEFVETLRAEWNERCGKLAKSRISSKNTFRLAREFLKRQGGDEAQALDIFRQGMAAVINDPWWLGNRANDVRRNATPYGIENYLRNVEDKYNLAMEITADTPVRAAPDTARTIKEGRQPRIGERWSTNIGLVDITGITAGPGQPIYSAVVRGAKHNFDDDGNDLGLFHPNDSTIQLRATDMVGLWPTGPDGKSQWGGW